MATAIDSGTRLRKLLIKAALICGVGLGYAFFSSIFQWGIPCPIHAITGLYCPGCGVSRMCMALLHLDFLEAASWNIGIMVILPIGIMVFFCQAVRYVKTGDARLRRWQDILIWVMIAWLLLFTVLRNLPWFSFLAPGGM